MQKFLRIVLFALAIAHTQAQVVTTQPTFPTADAEVTIIVDLKQARDGRAKGLLSKFICYMD